MGEPLEEYAFSHKEVVEALIKQQGLHDGIWMLNIRFGIGAINVNAPEGQEGPKNEAAPAAIVPIASIGLRKMKELGPLSLDAAAINPTSKAGTKKTKS